jgi:fucose 4-O-acetylase-like acetyltransferase
VFIALLPYKCLKPFDQVLFLQMNNNRDQVIDLFKGFTILWIIHIHTVFWSGELYLPNYLRELSLFIDVPIFFFLSGYLVFFGSLKDIFNRSLRQVKRLYLTYVILSLVVFFVVILLRFLFGYSIPAFSATLLNIIKLNVVFPEFRGFEWNLWFLRTYLVLIIIVPVFAIWRQNLFRNVTLSILSFASFIVLGEYSYTSVLLSLLIFESFYAALFFLGSTFRIIEKHITLRQFVISLVFVLFFVCMAIHTDEYRIVLQAHKFPPSLPYFSYSLLFLYVFVFFKCFHHQLLLKIPSVIKNLLKWSSREVFNIYLVQSFICSLPFFFIPWLRGIVPPLLLYCMTLLFNLTFTIFFVWLLRHILFMFSRSK